MTSSPNPPPASSHMADQHNAPSLQIDKAITTTTDERFQDVAQLAHILLGELRECAGWA